MGNKFKPSKDYGVSVICKGQKLGADVDISGIFTTKFVNNVSLLFSKKNDMIPKSSLKTIEPVQDSSNKKKLLMWGKKLINVRKSDLLTVMYYLMLWI